ncbi:MAG: TadE family type IV pilus minor pilin [Sporichthyaceae bacterium]
MSVRGRGRGSAGRCHGDRGAVTVELALAMPALVLVLAAAVWVISVLSTAMACTDAARAGARAAARGESEHVVRAIVRDVGPAGAQLTQRVSGAVVLVRVRVRIEAPWGLPAPGVDVGGQAVAALEYDGASSGAAPR